MRSAIRNKRILPVCLVILAALLAATLSLGSCTGSEKVASKKEVPQKTFASPDDAGSALLDAAKSTDQDAWIAMFGPDATSALFSGDAVKDKAALDDFVAAYNQMHRWREIKAGGQMLYVGADNYAFPIPLGENSAGQWAFDTAAGKDEILARRIGNGELTAIAATAAMSDAQEEYFDQTHDGDPVKQYAQKFVSDEGRQNGLYWTAPDGQSPSPLNNVRDFVKAVGYVTRANKPPPFKGYCFRILTKQGDQAKGGAMDYVVGGKLTGGFAILAYPAEYRNSGIMTFIAGKDGVVYQKDLGEKTPDVAAAMVEYNPGDGWNPALP